MAKFKLLAVIDNLQEELWSQLELEVGTNTCSQVAAWMRDKVGHDEDGEVCDELPVFDEVVAEDGDYIITYHDLGMCESVYLYKKLED